MLQAVQTQIKSVGKRFELESHGGGQIICAVLNWLKECCEHPPAPPSLHEPREREESSDTDDN